MTKKVISTIKHYKREKDGTLRFVGIEKREVEEHHWGHIDSLDIRDKADARRLAHEQEEFERLSTAPPPAQERDNKLTTARRGAAAARTAKGTTALIEADHSLDWS